jgi:hypothetical protein
MKQTLLFVIFACGVVSAQPAATKPAEAAPSDSLRLEIARAQRDLLLADAQMREAVERYNAAKSETEGLQKALAEKIAEAIKACGENQTFDAGKLACVPVAPSAKTR